MDLLRWGRSPWGEWVLTHVSWSLFWASLFAGVLFFVAHASYMLFSAHRKRSAAETDALEAAHKNLPVKIERVKLVKDPGGDASKDQEFNRFDQDAMLATVEKLIQSGAAAGHVLANDEPERYK